MQAPKVNATLAAFVLADIARSTGRNFPLRDRISREEAAALSAEFARSPAMRERTEAGRRGVALYRRVLVHFGAHHPSDAAGQPQPWDVPAHVATDPQNPFKGMRPDHAQSVISWALTQRAFAEARLDRRHAQHAIVAEQWRQLHEVAFPQPGTATGAPAPAAAPPAAPAAVVAQPFAPAPSAASPSSAIDSAARLRAELAQLPRTDRRREQLVEQLVATTQTPA